MKTNLIILLTALCAISPSCTTTLNLTAPTSKKAKAKRVKTVKTTAYTHNERDHIKYGRKTAIGTTLRTGVVATDWSVFPLGTKLKIDGHSYVVEDYGSALVGKSTPVVDIYKPCFTSMNRHGARMYDIEVISWGCFNESKNILSKRLKWKHCREMYYNIDNGDNGA